jgi:hypothetical protein
MVERLEDVVVAKVDTETVNSEKEKVVDLMDTAEETGFLVEILETVVV